MIQLVVGSMNIYRAANLVRWETSTNYYSTRLQMSLIFAGSTAGCAERNSSSSEVIEEIWIPLNDACSLQLQNFMFLCRQSASRILVILSVALSIWSWVHLSTALASVVSICTIFKNRIEHHYQRLEFLMIVMWASDIIDWLAASMDPPFQTCSLTTHLAASDTAANHHRTWQILWSDFLLDLSCARIHYIEITLHWIFDLLL